jgi:hypothetical protein
MQGLRRDSDERRLSQNIPNSRNLGTGPWSLVAEPANSGVAETTDPSRPGFPVQ